MHNMIFISFDGDNIGKQIGQSVLTDNPELLNELSHKIQAGNQMVSSWVKQIGGTEYSSGGDQGVYAIPAENVEDIEAIRKDYEFIVGATATFGIGNSLSESGKALIVGKLKGKNQTVIYNEEIEKELLQAKQNLTQGIGTEDEQKQGESYLDSALGGNMEQNKTEHNHADCEYCKEYDAKNGSDHSDCPHCAEYDSKQSEELSSCPYCEEMDSKVQSEHSDCPHCAEYDAKNAQVQPTDGPIEHLPTTQDSQNFQDQGLQDPAIPKPGVNENPMGLSPEQDTETVNNRILESKQGESNEKETMPDQEINQEGIRGGEESPEDILQAIVAEGSQVSQENEKLINQDTDSTELAVGANMEENVSRPEGYDQEQVQGDMGLSEDGSEEPNLTDVVGEDLDSQADNIQKEKAIQMISEALEGFKGCREILEKAKEQAPQLYSSTIAMLRAMIEMGKMLGLESNQQEPSPQDDQWDSEITGEHEQQDAAPQEAPEVAQVPKPQAQ